MPNYRKDDYVMIPRRTLAELHDRLMDVQAREWNNRRDLDEISAQFEAYRRLGPQTQTAPLYQSDAAA